MSQGPHESTGFKRRHRPLRLTLLAALAAAFLLIPSAQAFAAGTVTLNIEGTGDGEVSSVGGFGGFGILEGEPPIECSYLSPGPATGVCENEQGTEPEEGLEGVAMHATADPGSEFVGWAIESGPPAIFGCPQPGEPANCNLIQEEGEEADWVVTAFFELLTQPLTVVKGGSVGGGTVTSSPAGMNCDPSCEEETASFPENEVVTLEATPESGYVFAGWIGCKNAGGCQVTMSEAREVTAIFLKEGTEGEAGEDGEGVTVTPEDAGANCANGGVKVESSAGTEYVCNGTDGTDGTDGTNGSDGSDGEPGKDGATGAAGPAGSQGPAGPQGAQGPQGPAGKVTCKVKQKGKKVKVTCKVKTASASSSQRRLGWRLMKGGRTYSHGRTQGGKLNLDLSNLRPGRYVLRVRGERGGTRIVVG